MAEILRDCKCIDSDDKYELRESVSARIGSYHKSIASMEAEEMMMQTGKLSTITLITKKPGKIKLKPSPEAVKKVNQYRDIIKKLEDLYNRLGNTPEC